MELHKFIKEPSINRGNVYAETPLHLAAKNRQKDIIEILLKKGVDVNLVATKNRTVLHFLLEDQVDKDKNEEESCEEILKLLISKGVPVKIKNSDGQTLLHLAAQNKLKDVILILLPLLDKFYDSTDNWGHTALHYLLDAIKNEDGCEEKEYIDIVKIMLDKCPVMINIGDKRGRTLLHISVQNKQKEIIQILLSYYK